jgi:hypothetical protein
MAYVYGREFTRWELMKRVGDISQIAGARQCTLESGKSRGVSAVDVKTGSGLNFTILPDRGMDIAWADYKGISLGFISKTGVVSPSYYEPDVNGFLRGFYGGLLTTCGITYMGASCVDQGKSLGLHGRASNTPAEDVCVSNSWNGDDFTMCVGGRVRESVVFGENITLTREIKAKLGENRIVIKDIVENCGFERQPLMLLYHCNFGYPILDSETRLILPEGTVKARDKEAEKGINNYSEFAEPTHRYSEQVFYHDFKPQADGKVSACIFNKNLLQSGLGVNITYNKNQLPNFIEWKQIGEGDYVVGLEPATWYPEGRSEARKRGELKFIEQGESKEFEIEIEIREGIET